jgi:hypothetical protein
MAEVADSAAAVQQCAQELLERVRGVLPHGAAWLAVRDPETRAHRPIGQDGGTEALARYVALPLADDELQLYGMNRRRAPIRASDVPVPLAEIVAWGEFRLPAGFRDRVAVGLFAEDGRHLGFVSLLSDESHPQLRQTVDLLERLRPLLSRALDRLPSLVAAAELAGDAIGGTVLTTSGRCLPVPGLPGHPLLAPDSPVVAVARRHAATAGARSSFLSPFGEGLVRITVLGCRDESVDHLVALVLVRRATDLAGLSPTDLRLLGGLLEGWDDDRVGAGCGVRRVSSHTSRLAERLGAASVHGLLVDAARNGRYVPPALWR